MKVCLFGFFPPPEKVTFKGFGLCHLQQKSCEAADFSWIGFWGSSYIVVSYRSVWGLRKSLILCDSEVNLEDTSIFFVLVIQFFFSRKWLIFFLMKIYSC